MTVISVENVSKRFVLAHDRSRNLSDAAWNVLRRRKREEFWALKDVSFEVKQGESLGIIGHNGAGKSTLLKLLTRIMQPTSGRIRTRGRISALIEVGAGFHPEMSGRENVYLNGSILGMTRREIDRKLDSIVEFAELEKFIDTPVKRYSSGMYARLGFAVAAHVDPEILLIDEVLSVGDERFQVKCQERMSALMQSGVTVLFISHNLAVVAALCNRSIVLANGSVKYSGDTNEAIRVCRSIYAQSSVIKSNLGESVPASPVYLTGVRVLDGHGDHIEQIETCMPMIIELSGTALTVTEDLNFAVEIIRADGVKVYDVNCRMDGRYFRATKGDFVLQFVVPECNLTDGHYTVHTGIMDRQERIHYHAWPHCAQFCVRDDKGYRGIARLNHSWHVQGGLIPTYSSECVEDAR